MVVTYAIADMLARLNVASKKRLVTVKVAYTKFSLNVLKVLWNNGVISGFSVLYDKNGVKYILVNLKYYNNKSIFRELSIVSRPGKRVYWTLNYLSLKSNYSTFSGFYIISTSKGLLTSSDCLLGFRFSGEIILKVII